MREKVKKQGDKVMEKRKKLGGKKKKEKEWRPGRGGRDLVDRSGGL